MINLERKMLHGIVICKNYKLLKYTFSKLKKCTKLYKYNFLNSTDCV